MDDLTFISNNENKIINFKIGNKQRKALPIGRYLAIVGGVTGFVLYNRKLKRPIIESEFESIVSLHKLCVMINELCGEYLIILADDGWAEWFFGIMQWTIPHGKKLYKGMHYLESFDGLITKEELEKAFS